MLASCKLILCSSQRKITALVANVKILWWWWWKKLECFCWVCSSSFPLWKLQDKVYVYDKTSDTYRQKQFIFWMPNLNLELECIQEINTEHLKVVSVEMLFMKVSNNIIGTLILTSGWTGRNPTFEFWAIFYKLGRFQSRGVCNKHGNRRGSACRSFEQC